MSAFASLKKKTAALAWGAAVFAFLGACKPCKPDWKTCASVCDEQGFKVLVTARPTESLHASKVRVALMVTTAHGDDRPDKKELQAWVDTVVGNTNALLGACGVGLEVLRAELVAVPSSFLSVTASSPESTGGVPPDGGTERLTPQVRQLLEFARRELPDDTLTVIALDKINYYVAQQPAVAGGLSFPPLAYRHADDFPAHRGVLIGTAYGRCGGVPALPAERTVAHELGHMLLNAPAHDDDSNNLMSKMLGATLRPDQCQRIRESLLQRGEPRALVR